MNGTSQTTPRKVPAREIQRKDAIFKLRCFGVKPRLPEVPTEREPTDPPAAPQDSIKVEPCGCRTTRFADSGFRSSRTDRCDQHRSPAKGKSGR